MKALIELVKTNVEARAILIGVVVASVILGGILF